MTYEIRCADAGAISCGGHIAADNEEEFKTQLLQHLADKHGVSEPNGTLVDYLMSVATTSNTGGKSLKF